MSDSLARHAPAIKAGGRRVKRHHMSKSPTQEEPAPADVILADLSVSREMEKLARELHPAHDPHPLKCPAKFVDRPRFNIQQPRKITN